MDAGVATLLGVLLGTGGTLLATRMSLRSSERQAEAARRYAREEKVQQLASEAYPSAVEAIQWLSTSHVEDSVDPRWEAEYAPRTERAVERLRRARELLSQVAALEANPTSHQLALDTVVALGILDHSWHETQDSRRKVVEGKTAKRTGKLQEFYEGQFDREFHRLDAAREKLCGFDAGSLTREQIDAGSVKEGSLLFRLRAMSSGAKRE